VPEDKRANIGHDLDEPSRLAFVIAHEIAHIVLGDCSAEHAVVEEDEIVADDAEIEHQADKYARALLTGDVEAPDLHPIDFKDLAIKALEQEKKLSIDASSIIWSWARSTGDYQLATMAIKALYRNKGGKRLVRQHFDEHVNAIDAPEHGGPRTPFSRRGDRGADGRRRRGRSCTAASDS
jgi:hypothetical protein